MATYWTEKGVRCNAMRSVGVENGQPLDFLYKVSSRTPMNRLAKAHKYQGTLTSMLFDASSYLNGAIIPVDGGAHGN
jgi:NAD(P)-dependent dehydrogenase (short-subunit alcohol dehydrogenase family)